MRVCPDVLFTCQNSTDELQSVGLHQPDTGELLLAGEMRSLEVMNTQTRPRPSRPSIPLVKHSPLVHPSSVLILTRYQFIFGIIAAVSFLLVLADPYRFWHVSLELLFFDVCFMGWYWYGPDVRPAFEEWVQQQRRVLLHALGAFRRSRRSYDDDTGMV